MDVGDLIREMAEKEEQILKNSAKELKTLGNASLWIEKTKTRTRYYKVMPPKESRNREGINRKPGEIARLARKGYLESEIEIVRNNLNALHKMQKLYDTQYTVCSLENILANMAGRRNAAVYQELFQEYRSQGIIKSGKGEFMSSLDMETHKLDDTTVCEYLKIGNLSSSMHGISKRELNDYLKYSGKIIEWMESSYVKSNYRQEDLKHRTTRGLWLRSKSEVLIAEKLYGHRIPFRSEEVIRTPLGIVVPDFVMPDWNGQMVFWEHAGMMDKQEYREKHRRSLEKYESVGIVPWKNLIVTYDDEDGGIDLERIEMEIKTRLL